MGGLISIAWLILQATIEYLNKQLSDHDVLSTGWPSQVIIINTLAPRACKISLELDSMGYNWVQFENLSYCDRPSTDVRTYRGLHYIPHFDSHRWGIIKLSHQSLQLWSHYRVAFGTLPAPCNMPSQHLQQLTFHLDVFLLEPQLGRQEAHVLQRVLVQALLRQALRYDHLKQAPTTW